MLMRPRQEASEFDWSACPHWIVWSELIHPVFTIREVKRLMLPYEAFVGKNRFVWLQMRWDLLSLIYYWFIALFIYYYWSVASGNLRSSSFCSQQPAELRPGRKYLGRSLSGPLGRRSPRAPPDPPLPSRPPSWSRPTGWSRRACWECSGQRRPLGTGRWDPAACRSTADGGRDTREELPPRQGGNGRDEPPAGALSHLDGQTLAQLLAGSRDGLWCGEFEIPELVLHPAAVRKSENLHLLNLFLLLTVFS